jgi:hypothetical protein
MSGYSDLITARLQKNTEELRAIQQMLTMEGIDPRVLMDFREAVDHVRLTAWGVQQFIELRETRKDPFSAIALLAAERIRRATQLCRDVGMDADAGEVGPDTPGLSELKAEVTSLVNRLKTVLP